MRINYLFILVFLHSVVCAQINIPSQPFQLIDKKADNTTLSLYSSIRTDSVTSFKVLDPFFAASFNSAYPRSYNDGPIWKGKGLTLEAHGGVQGSKGKFTYTFYPTVFYSQNSNYDLAPGAEGSGNKFAYWFSDRIDWVQQYGDGPFIQFHPGQSELKMDWGKFITALSTQNYSLGPSIYNPIILSRQAGGFPHLRLGIEPTNLKLFKKDIGKIEANLIYGILSESDYFDNDSGNDYRFFNDLTIAYQPSFLPELTLGLTKALYKQTQFFEAEDLISTLFIIDNGVKNGDTLSPNDTFDQTASIFLDWNIKEAGFRAYTEFAKNDFSTDSQFRFFASEPEHSRAYTIGFEKVFTDKKNRNFTLTYEHTNLSRNHTFLWRAEPIFYTHGINKQGYTQEGQIIGAGIGPGGNADNLGLEISDDKQRRLKFLLQRIEHNKDYFVVNITPNDPTKTGKHDVEYSAGVVFQEQKPTFTYFISGTFSYNYNRYYLASQDEINIALAFGTQLMINR